MPTFRGRFEYIAPGRRVVRSGDCDLTFDRCTATLVGDGPSLAFDLGDIDTYEAGEYHLRLSLFDGHDVLLTRFAKAFTDLERQLRDAFRDRLVQCLLVGDLDEVARFTGRVQLDSPARPFSGLAELRVYESNLAVLPDAGVGFQWRLADVDGVAFDDAQYAVTVARGPECLSVGRLAKRTAEFAGVLRSKIATLRERSARALHGVMPFLGPEQFARVAAAMPEGTSASIADIGGVHPLVERVLLSTVVDDGLRPYVATLAARSSCPWFAGFKVIRREGPAEEDGVDAEVSAEAGREVLDAGDGLELLFWFFFPLGPARGAPTHLAWEATSRGGRATYVFKLSGDEPLAESVAALNRGLASLNFRREPVYLEAQRLEGEQRYRHYAIALRKLPELARVRESFVGRAIHTTHESWLAQLGRLVG